MRLRGVANGLPGLCKSSGMYSGLDKSSEHGKSLHEHKGFIHVSSCFFTTLPSIAFSDTLVAMTCDSCVTSFGSERGRRKPKAQRRAWQLQKALIHSGLISTLSCLAPRPQELHQLPGTKMMQTMLVLLVVLQDFVLSLSRALSRCVRN